jgi:hypothetical protein
MVLSSALLWRGLSFHPTPCGRKQILKYYDVA